jgi:hypothetical protein
MVETFGMTGMLVLAFLVLVVVYILMRIFKVQDSPGDEEEIENEGLPEAEHIQMPAEMSDEEFIDSYTGPILEDARGSLESGAGAIENGLYFYDRGTFEEASAEFHTAVNKIDEAAERFKEVPGLVEDPGSKPVVDAKARIDECRRLRALTIRMEEACDAMVEGKIDDARKLAEVKSELEQAIAGYKQER